MANMINKKGLTETLVCGWDQFSKRPPRWPITDRQTKSCGPVFIIAWGQNLPLQSSTCSCTAWTCQASTEKSDNEMALLSSGRLKGHIVTGNWLCSPNMITGSSDPAGLERSGVRDQTKWTRMTHDPSLLPYCLLLIISFYKPLNDHFIKL